MGGLTGITAGDVFQGWQEVYRGLLNEALIKAYQNRAVTIQLPTKTKEEADAYTRMAEEHNLTSGDVILEPMRRPPFDEYVAFNLVHCPDRANNQLINEVRGHLVNGCIHIWVIHIIVWIIFFFLWKNDELLPSTHPIGFALSILFTLFSIISSLSANDQGQVTLSLIEQLVIRKKGKEFRNNKDV